MVKALPHFGGEPFFVLNSDSIWVEGYSSALPAMTRLWDESRMDGLLLLAAMDTAWAMKAGAAISVLTADRPCRPRAGPHAFRPSPIPACRSCIRACSPMRPQGAFSTNVMWDRAIAKGRLYRHACWTACGFMSARREARDEAEAYLAAAATA